MTAAASLPLSAGQAEIWFDEKFHGRGVAYNSAGYLDIRGPLDVPAFRAAVRQLIVEAECTRTRYVEVDGEPRQVVEPMAEVPITALEVGEAEAVEWMAADLAKPFTLDDFPLFRLALVDLGQDRHFFYMCIHHLLCDGYSQVVYWRRLAEIYQALVEGRSAVEGQLSPLKELLDAERAYTDSVWFQRDRDFWAARFDQVPDLPSLSQREQTATAVRGFLRRTTVVPAETAATLRELASKSASTWPAVVLAAVGVYTQRMTGVGDVLLTLPATARMGASMRAIPGMIANYLPLRVTVRPDATKADLLRRTSRELAQVLKHQRYRVSRIRREMGLSSEDRRPFGPFVNILPQQTTFALGSCGVEVNNLSTGLIEDLMITVVDAPDGGAEVHVNGNPELYTAQEVEDHLHRFAEFLVTFATVADDVPLGRVDVVSAPERAGWLEEGTGAFAEGADADLVDTVRALASRYPDAVAVVEDDVTTTYGALVARASALSRRVPAELVGVLGAPGAGFISAVLGVLGAGGAYVPLDTRAPVRRGADLLTDNGIRHLVVDAAHRALAEEITRAAGHAVDVVVLDDAEDDDLAPVVGLPDDLAYVIFTSGSTGKPKGAMVHRRGMVNHLLAKVDDLALTAADSLVQNAPLTFDISVWQMLAPLVVGGRVRVVTRETAADPDALFGLVADESVTILEVVPSLLRAALDAWDVVGDRPRLPSLRRLVVTGEALPPDLCLRWFARFPTIPLVNAYGPTECSDDVTHATITVDDAVASARVPIGRAVRGTRLYVLGDDLGPVPPGVPGELYVGGLGVGRGYLRDPARTSTTFVPDPFAGTGLRMYRTGDRVVRREDGQLEFVERRDHQVKVRGHRIELGEIESALRGLPHVGDAAVAVVTDPVGSKRLIGYLVSDNGNPVDTDDVRARLAAVLPEYMVPSTLLTLDAMPLTPHGKVDRKALPEPDFSAGPRGRTARSSEERVLCEVMAEVLGLPEVGVEDSFFALGGDSISSIQVVSRARRAGLLITSRDVLKHRSPAAIATIARPAGAVATAVADGVGEVELTPIAHQLREDLESLTDRTRQYSQYVVVRVPGDIASLTTALRAVVDHHDVLRAKLSVPVDGLWSLETLPAGSVPVEITEASDVDTAVTGARQRLAPEEGRVVQAALVGDRLVLVIHHLVVDGVSWRILVPDLKTAFEAVVAGRPIALDPVGTSYRRWSKVLSENARTAARTRELPLWTAQVKPDDPQLGSRPLDPSLDTYGTAKSLRVVLPATTTAALLTTVPAAFHGEINDVLLSGLALAVAEWRRKRLGAGGPGVLVEVEGHGREQVADDLDLSRTVGWFTSVFPLRVDPGDATGGVAVKRVKEQLRALPDRGLGFGLLRHLNPQTVGALARFGVPQIGFNYLGRFAAGGADAQWSLDGGDSVVGTGVSPDMPLRHVLAVTPVTEDRPDGPHLVADWLWAGDLLSESDVDEIATSWFRVLESFVGASGGHSPSDFPLVSLSEAEIEDFEGAGGVDDVLPLSALQKGLLFQAEYDKQGSDVYTLQAVVDVEGPLDVAAFRAAAEALVQRHPALRASFRSRPAGDAVQVIRSSVALPWQEVDLTGMADEDAASELVRLTDADWAHRFDMTEPPLVRFTVVRLGDERFRLLWAVHHILVDGWSMPIFARELFTLCANGADVSALPPVAPYRDYLAWLGAQDVDAARTAWTTAFDGFTEAAKLGPAERDRVSDVPESFVVDLPEDVTHRLSSWARARGLTLNTVMQGCWAVLLGRLTGKRDVAFGAVSSGRPAELPGMESMVGLFLNTLPVRVRLDPKTSLADLLARLQEDQFDLAPHHHLGLAEVQQSVGIGELFDTVVSFHNYPHDVDDLSDLIPGVRVLGADGRLVAEYPFGLMVYPGKRLRLLAQYRSDSFDQAAVESVVDRFRRLLTSLVTEPDVPLSRLDLLAADERSLILGDWAGDPKPVATAVVPEVFEARAAAAPDAVAAVFEGTSLSYAGLNTRANQLARLLIGRGIGPERVVALAMPRSLEALVAVLAVLKAGAAYLPIDAKYPADRVDFMVSDANPAVLLSTAAVADGLTVTGAPVLAIDAPDLVAELAALPSHDVTDPERLEPLSQDHPAYVIYTSGSTGRPKGVVVDHRGFVAMAASLIEKFEITPDTNVLQFASYSFDATVWEFALPLLAGGTVVVAGDEARAPGQPLVDLITDNGVTLAALPPVVAGGLAEGTVLPADLVIVVAGEACPPEVVARWSATHRMFNGYGPTESVIAATVGGPLSPGGRPPIGTPTSAHRVYVLDSVLQPVPAGVVGDLYVSGGLARGYLNRPGLTGERFVADPFFGHGARMYRTGDLVRWHADGQLDYVGRADDQVQLRGFRIELGEIESALVSHGAVAQAVAIVREDPTGDKRLVAYVVVDEGTTVPVGLRELLVESLPEYMVPSAIVVLDEIPLTPQGKVDRKALPEPDFAGQGRGRGPRTPVEDILCGIFADVLDLPQVGIDDDFFALGGHSLLATRVISRARAALGVELPIRALFETRTVAGVAEQVHSVAGAGRPALVPAQRSEDGVVPLSFAQQRLWFLDRLEEGSSGTYNVPLAVRLVGELDVDALRVALHDLVVRHEILRSVFPDVEGEPFQRVLDAPEGYPELPLKRLSEAKLSDAMTAEADLAFDLATEPVLRSRLFAVSPTEHVLLLVIHHIAFDGWSIAPLVGDLGAAYKARSTGQAPEWEPLPVQYADYAVWQKDLLGSDSDPDSLLAHQLAYWTGALADLPEELELPTDFPRPAVSSYDGDELEFAVEPELYRALVALARDSGASIFMLFQAALSALLTKLGAGTDIPLGSPTAGRADEELGELVGFFVNTLVMRTDTSGDPSFRDLVHRVRDTNLAAYQHQDVPFEHLVDALNPVRSLNRQPLFQVMLTLQTSEDAPLLLPGLTGRVEPVRSLRSKFDLTVLLEEQYADGLPAGMRGVVEYSTDLFTKASAERLARRLVTFLRTVVADPNTRLSRVDVLEAGEHEELLAIGTGDVRPEVYEGVVERVRGFALSTPDAIAVVDDRAQVTYAELVGRASALSRRVPGSDLSAVLASPGIGFVTAVLGILGAGGGYVPLDVAAPVARVAALLTDSGATRLVVDEAHRELAAEIAEAAGIAVVVLDDAVDTDLAPALGEADDLAYVIFTSGSTGKPKGAMVHRRGMVNHLLCKVEDLEVSSVDKLVHNAPVTFDISVWQMLTTLLVGGTTRVVGRDTAVDPDLLFATIPTEGVTILEVVPSLLRAALDSWDVTDEVPELPGLKWLVVTGEALPPDLCGRWFQRFPDIALVNAYGPTECSDDVTHAFITKEDELGEARVPIGRPVRNTRLYVLGDDLRPVPAGVAGELYVGGTGVGRGYLGDRTKTALAFTADPFGEPGARMYRTGDRVVLRPDGQLEFLERRDHQVKIRGHRIELGEVEAALRSADVVGDAAVAVSSDQGGHKKLVGYVVPAPGDDGLDLAVVRKHLAGSLPEYMVPSALVVLDALPLTPNGKVDRKALPDADFAAQPRAVRGPRTPVEEILCGVFAEVLGAAEVGVDDDFFDLGGHSLLATRVVSRVRTVLDVELPVRALFEARTVAGLARLVEGAEGARPALVAQERDGDEGLPLSYAQRRLWFLNRMEEESTGTYNIPLAVRLTGELDVDALTAALGDVVARNEILRTVFPDVDGVPYQEVLSQSSTELTVRRVAEADLFDVVAAEVDSGFDLGSDTAVRTHLFVLDERDHVLLLVFHHIAFDGWSTAPLARDLAVAYDARRSGQAPQWAPLVAQYADYAVWQREWLGSETDPDSVLSAQLAYWTEALAGLPEELELPTDFPRPAISSYDGDVRQFSVPADLHAGVVALARETGASVFMVVQAAVSALLTKLGAGTDIPLGSPIAGRTDEALHDLIGFFVNTLVLRTDTAGDPTFRQLLHRVREADLGAYAHQDLPFEALVEAVNPTRSLSRHPLFQVMLSFQNNDEPADAMPGLESGVVPMKATRSKFDLEFELVEQHDDGTPAGMDGVLAYRTDLFTERTVDEIGERLVRLLRAVVTSPDAALSEVDVLSVAERHRILVEWNDTGRALSAFVLPDLISATAAGTPNATAVIAGDVTLTYRQLTARANRLARELIARGAGPERVVALALTRGADLIVSALAVLKSGAAYLPIDLDHPADRVRYMLDDAEPVLVITDEAAADRVPELAGTPSFVLGGAEAERALRKRGGAEDVTDADRSGFLTPNHPAYVMYTSGSTGRPKGVVIPHGALANLITDMCERLSMTKADRLLAVTTFGFDISNLEIFVPLVAGAKLIVADRDTVRDPIALGALMVSSRTSVMQATPSLWQALVGITPESLRRVRVVITGGEALSESLADALRAAAHEVRNMYGPTETTIWSTVSDVDTAGPGTPTIGRPISNTRVYVLDSALCPVPPNVPGELYIAGDGLARGYLNRTDLTSERFLANPFGEPGSRMYRTGDVVRWDNHGEIEFLGRKDHQVKVRGHRIELGEIEAALRAEDAVVDAVVTVGTDAGGHKRLVGYLLVPSGELDTAEVKRSLGVSLPEYMVPAALVVLPAFPLTPNGKVDRKALPEPDFGARTPTREPESAAEHLLVEVFGDVLGIGEVRIDDDFFELGGHSLLATGVVSRARKAGLRLTIADVFVHKTVRALAAAAQVEPDSEAASGAASMARALHEIEELDQEDPFATILPIRPTGDRTPFFFIHSGLGSALPYVGLARHVDERHPIYGVQSPSVGRMAPLPTSMEEVAELYVGHIKEVRPEGPYNLLGWSFGGVLAQEIAVRLQAAGDTVELLVNLDGYPHRPGHDDEEVDDREQLVRVMEVIGHDRAEFDGRELTARDVVEVLRRDRNPLAELGEERLLAMLAVVRNHGKLMERFTPSRYTGAMRLFAAVEDLTEAEVGELADAWAPHVDGPVELHAVHCGHEYMMHPEPQALIGAAVAADLRRVLESEIGVGES
ncbi:amino acid adenylation domain-containing protein [Umezawaea endophytica]|uniref:Amino acid adenylation domain-containing protein n=1 Tax=Umezawaea endophytica TaxID=1654476 RepID=A0A9X3A2U2_9PSEU|nr:non-ribosomal peptide synthetase [Umezawaea endophytica]MCS7481004.1 amino acid adenylation domain-containing protein [Umezawaea endophytica]